MNAPDPVMSRDEEPHRRRRRVLLRRHPELRGLMGHDSKTAWTIALLVGVQLAISASLASLLPAGGSGRVLSILAVAYVVGATLNHWLAMGIHEASHDLALRGERRNRILAIFANLPLVAPSAMAFRRHHPHHHKHLGDPARDNDLPTPLEARWVGNSTFRKVVWLFTLPLTAPTLRGFLQKPDSWELVNIGVQVAFNAWVVCTFGSGAFLYLMLSSFFGAGLHPVATHWVHEHYLVNGRQETRSHLGPLNWVTFNVGYHVEHHDLFNIPGSRLPRVRKMAPEMYNHVPVDTSWVRVLFTFLADSRISHASRIVRAHGMNPASSTGHPVRVGAAQKPRGDRPLRGLIEGPQPRSLERP